jgi:hypothetical protein
MMDTTQNARLANRIESLLNEYGAWIKHQRVEDELREVIDELRANKAAPNATRDMQDGETSAPTIAGNSETKPTVWAVLKHYDYEGDDLVAILGTKEEAEAVAEKMRLDSYADRIKVQEWKIGEVSE